jgi:hypothetical protein
MELLLILTTLIQALDDSQVVRKYIREQRKITDELFSLFNIIKKFTDTSLL